MRQSFDLPFAFIMEGEVNKKHRLGLKKEFDTRDKMEDSIH